MPLGIVWPQDQLTLLYHMENANDSGPNYCDLANSGVSFARSKFGQGAVFDSTSDRLYSSYPYLDPEEANFTGMFWLKVNTAPTEARYIWTASTIAGEAVVYYNNILAKYVLRVGSTSVSFPASPTVCEWHHVAFSVGTGVVLYWDGAVVATGARGLGGGGTDLFSFGFNGGSALYCAIDEAVFFLDIKTPQWIRKYYAWATGKL